MANSTNGNGRIAKGVFAGLAFFASLLGAAWGGGVLVSAQQTRTEMTLAEHGRQLDDHEQRLRATEKMAADVAWIKSFLERHGP